MVLNQKKNVMKNSIRFLIAVLVYIHIHMAYGLYLVIEHGQDYTFISTMALVVFTIEGFLLFVGSLWTIAIVLTDIILWLAEWLDSYE